MSIGLRERDHGRLMSFAGVSNQTRELGGAPQPVEERRGFERARAGEPGRDGAGQQLQGVIRILEKRRTLRPVVPAFWIVESGEVRQFPEHFPAVSAAA